MKKCPFCKADIEDNARFCLYCMKPLNKKEVLQPLQRKRHRWPFAAAGVVVAVLAALALLRPWEADLPAEGAGGEGESASQVTESQTAQSTDASTQDTQSADGGQPEDIPTENNQTAPGTTDAGEPSQQIPNQDGQQLPEETKPEETNPPQPETPDETLPPDTEPTKEPETTLPEEPTEDPTQPEAPKSEVVYTYREARAGDDFNANYTNSGNDIVITGIAQQAADGVYDIPSYIDGKRVIAIVANAFYGSNAKVVYVPATVKNIFNYAFNGCALTDIYFRGSAIYVENRAFSSALTIHCSASCSDRNLRYFKNSASNYGAAWEEWNG